MANRFDNELRGASAGSVMHTMTVEEVGQRICHLATQGWSEKLIASTFGLKVEQVHAILSQGQHA